MLKYTTIKTDLDQKVQASGVLNAITVCSSTGSTEESLLEAPRIKVPQHNDFVDANLPLRFGRKLEFTPLSNKTFSACSSIEEFVAPSPEEKLTDMPEVRYTTNHCEGEAAEDISMWEPLKRSEI